VAPRPLATAVTAVPGVVVEAGLQICLGGAMATALPPSGRLGAVVAAFPLKENLRQTVGVGFFVFFHFLNQFLSSCSTSALLSRRFGFQLKIRPDQVIL